MNLAIKSIFVFIPLFVLSALPALSMGGSSEDQSVKQTMAKFAKDEENCLAILESLTNAEKGPFATDLLVSDSELQAKFDEQTIARFDEADLIARKSYDAVRYGAILDDEIDKHALVAAQGFLAYRYLDEIGDHNRRVDPQGGERWSTLIKLASALDQEKQVQYAAQLRDEYRKLDDCTGRYSIRNPNGFEMTHGALPEVRSRFSTYLNNASKVALVLLGVYMAWNGSLTR